MSLYTIYPCNLSNFVLLGYLQSKLRAPHSAASDVKGLWRFRHHSCICWHILALIGKKIRRLSKFYRFGTLQNFVINLDWYMSRKCFMNEHFRKPVRDNAAQWASLQLKLFCSYLRVSHTMCYHDWRMRTSSMCHRSSFSKLLLSQC